MINTLLLYAASYLLLLQPQEYGLTGLGVYYYKRVPAYRQGGSVTSSVLLPLHLLDRQIRPSYWKGSMRTDPSDLDIPVRFKRNGGG